MTSLKFIVDKIYGKVYYMPRNMTSLLLHIGLISEDRVAERPVFVVNFDELVTELNDINDSITLEGDETQSLLTDGNDLADLIRQACDSLVSRNIARTVDITDLSDIIDTYGTDHGLQFDDIITALSDVNSELNSIDNRVNGLRSALGWTTRELFESAYWVDQLISTDSITTAVIAVGVVMSGLQTALLADSKQTEILGELQDPGLGASRNSFGSIIDELVTNKTANNVVHSSLLSSVNALKTANHDDLIALWTVIEEFVERERPHFPAPPDTITMDITSWIALSPVTSKRIDLGPYAQDRHLHIHILGQHLQTGPTRYWFVDYDDVSDGIPSGSGSSLIGVRFRVIRYAEYILIPPGTQYSDMDDPIDIIDGIPDIEVELDSDNYSYFMDEPHTPEDWFGGASDNGPAEQKVQNKSIELIIHLPAGDYYRIAADAVAEGSAGRMALVVHHFFE